MVKHRRIIDPACPINWQHPLNAGLIACWMVPPNSGGSGGLTVRDLCRRRDGTLSTQLVTSQRGRPGGYGAVNFAAVSQTTSSPYLSVSRDPNRFDFTTGKFSMFAWVKVASGDGTIGSRIKSTNEYAGWEFSVGTGGNNPHNALGFWNGSNWSSATTNIVDDKWHHVGVTHNGTSYIFFVDGKYDGDFGFGLPSNSDRDLYIGLRDGEGLNLNGLLDDYRIYDRDMTYWAFQLFEESRRGHRDTMNWISTPTVVTEQAAAATFHLKTLSRKLGGKLIGRAA